MGKRGPANGYGGRPKGSTFLSDAQIKRLVLAHEHGVSLELLSERFSICINTVMYYLRKHRRKLNAHKPAAHVHRDGAHGEQEGNVLPT